MNKVKLTVKDSSLAFFVGFLLCQLCVVVVSILITIFSNIFKFDITVFSNSVSGFLILSLSLYLTMLAVFFFFNKNKDNKITNKIQFSKLGIYVLIALCSFLMLYPIITCFDSLLIKLGIELNTLSYPLTTKNYFISLIPLVLAPAICEELLFRGIIFSGLKNHGKIFSITVSALMFSIYHMSISQTVYPLLMGLLLGVIMWHEQNIYYCIAVHLTNNFLSLTLSYFNISLVFNHWTYILLATILSVIFLTIVLTLTIKNHKHTHHNLNKQEKFYLFLCLGLMVFIWILSNLG